MEDQTLDQAYIKNAIKYLNGIFYICCFNSFSYYDFPPPPSLEIIQITTAITTTTSIIPVQAPALKTPSIAEQLFKTNKLIINTVKNEIVIRGFVCFMLCCFDFRNKCIKNQATFERKAVMT